MQEFSRTTWDTAGLTAYFIRQSWQHQGDQPELEALRQTLALDERTHQTLDGPFSVLPLSLEERYQLRAACLIIQDTIPFNQDERQFLMNATGSRNNLHGIWKQRATRHHKDLLEAWTGWLVGGKKSRRKDKIDIIYGEAALLEYACSSLAKVLEAVV